MTSEGVHTVTAGTRVDVVVPRPSDLVAFLDDDEVPSSPTLDHFDSNTYSYASQCRCRFVRNTAEAQRMSSWLHMEYQISQRLRSEHPEN